MPRIPRRAIPLVPLVLLGLLGGLLVASPAVAADPAPQLVEIRAAQHEGYDRLVFEFSGDLPEVIDITSVDQVVDQWTGDPLPAFGNAFLSATFYDAVGHDSSWENTYGPSDRAYDLPSIIQVIRTSDWENVLGFGIALTAETPFTVFTLTSPSRVVLDLDTTSLTTVTVQDYLIQSGSLDAVPVTREVVPPATAKGALQRLFAGPTQDEIAAGLSFVDSGATGFTGLTISAGVARVTLTGGCASNGSTTTIANEIVPTLKQFPSVQWVKIYDPAGETEEPSGNSDSIPFCLEP